LPNRCVPRQARRCGGRRRRRRHVDGESADVVEAGGMKELTRILHGLGFSYDSHSRRWLVPMQSESIFVQHQT
jgi:hypothetical protein